MGKNRNFLVFKERNKSMKYTSWIALSAILNAASVNLASAAQIDVLNDGVHYDNGDLISPDTTSGGDPIIAGDSLADEDAIVFVKSDLDETVNVGLGATDRFVLQGNVILNNPIEFTGDTLQVNGYLTDNTQATTNGSDLSGVNLIIDNYVIHHDPEEGEDEGEDEVINGKLVLKNDVTLGNATFNQGVQIHLYKPDNSVAIATNDAIKFAGNNLISGSEGSALFFEDGGGNVTFNGSNNIDENVSVTKMEVEAYNNGTLTVENDLVLNSNFTNNGNVSVGGNLNVDEWVNNDGSSLRVDGTATFNQDVENHRANVTLNSDAIFNNNVTSDGNTSFTVNGDVSFAKAVNNSGNTTMTFNKEVVFSNTGSLNAQDNAIIVTNKGAQFNVVNLDDYARLTANNEAIFIDEVAIAGHSRIVTNSGAAFDKAVNASGNSLLQVKGDTEFKAAVDNTGNAHLQIDGKADFLNAQTVTNEGNGVIDVNGKAVFTGAVNNIDDAQFNVNGTAEFDDTVTNSGYGRFTSNGDVIFHNDLNNDGSEAKLALNGNSVLENGLSNTGEVTIQGNTTIENALNNSRKMNVTGELTTDMFSNNLGAEANLGRKTTITVGAMNRGQINSTGDVNIEGVYYSTENGKLNVGGDLTFVNDGSYNEGQVTVSGNTIFKGNFENIATFKVSGDTSIEKTLTNDANAVMELNDVKFTGNSASLVNSGVLSLSNSVLRSNIVNNSGGVINLIGNNTLGENWSSAGDINFNSGAKLNLGSRSLTLNGGGNVMNFYDGATMQFNINKAANNLSGGQIIGDVVLNGNTELKPIFTFGISDGEYTFVDGSVDNSQGAWSGYSDNVLYNIMIDDSETKIVFTKKNNDEIADALGAKGTQTELLTGILSGTADNKAFNQMADNITAMLQSGDGEQKRKALQILDAISPEEAPMMQQAAIETSNQIFDVVGARLANRTPMMMKSWRRGMSSGDEFFDSGAAWVQGMGNKSELKANDDHSGFESTTTGVAMGFEKQVTENTRVGVGYAYSQTEVESDIRDIDVDTHTAIGYAEYKRNKIFLNAIAAYGWSDYKEDSAAASAKYVVESMGLQAMAGYYGLTTGVMRFIPEVGMRYVHIKQHDYDNSIGVKYDDSSSDVVTGIIGARISAIGGNGNGLKIIPEARLALTYDIENPDGNEALVTLPNGSSYVVQGKAMDRLGFEFGAGITAEINDNVDLSVNYEGKFRKDYTDHTGIIKGKYKF